MPGPGLHADLDDVDEPLRLGDPMAPSPPGAVQPAGAEAGELNIFG
ncbi:hypothetical protein ACWCQZ_06910 [Streptomyces sp. NPDC002285]